MTVLSLIEAGTLDPWVAAFLWEVLVRRSSLVVIAGPSGMGKTTLLTALSDFLSPAERLLPVRGIYDPLHFLDDPAVDPQTTTVMVNEISPHLPIYLWGPGVSRLLTSARRFPILATAHASSAQDLVAQLAGYPLRIPLWGIARLGVVVRLEGQAAGTEPRRSITEVTVLQGSDRGGIVLRPMLIPGSRVLDQHAARAWLGEDPGAGDSSAVAARHNVLIQFEAISSTANTARPRLRRRFAELFSRAVGDT